MRLSDWWHRAVRLDYPGHPDHAKVGIVLGTHRRTRRFEQRATVRWADGEISRVPVAQLHLA